MSIETIRVNWQKRDVEDRNRPVVSPYSQSIEIVYCGWKFLTVPPLSCRWLLCVIGDSRKLAVVSFGLKECLQGVQQAVIIMAEGAWRRPPQTQENHSQNFLAEKLLSKQNSITDLVYYNIRQKLSLCWILQEFNQFYV